jgi:hypothetical protein
MASGPLCTGILQQALPDILPDGTLAVELDGVNFPYLDGSRRSGSWLDYCR